MGVFWSALAGRLTERWLAAAAPAAVFWGAVLAAWCAGHGGVDAARDLVREVAERSAAAQVAGLLAILVGLLASGLLVSRLTQPLLRLMTGQWPAVLRPLAGPLVRRAGERLAARSARVTELERRPYSTLTAAEQRELWRLGAWLDRQPVPVELTPTRLGNLMRSSASTVRSYYGLEPAVVWPHLWLLLPDRARTELGAARARMDAAAAGGLWALLALPAVAWTWWTLPVALIVGGVSWGWLLPDATDVFCRLVPATFALYRADLYRTLRWPLPTDPGTEPAEGERLTAHLDRGEVNRPPLFTPDA
ncbi:hypothetical protein [Streptomyces sp. NPDC008150]|uniref:hypothetical protein n=1 Tax=Streptomyces sp. NPDC008150 TaxID=3364816 RepID=UPI0036E4E85C